MKSFFKIFAFLFITEIALGMLGVFLTQGVYINILNTIGHYIMLVISLPISLINKSYPFYASVPTYQAILLLMLNVAIHTGITVFIIKTTKKNEE